LQGWNNELILTNCFEDELKCAGPTIAYK
jgi:hypothetical protein